MRIFFAIALLVSACAAHASEDPDLRDLRAVTRAVLEAQIAPSIDFGEANKKISSSKDLQATIGRVRQLFSVSEANQIEVKSESDLVLLITAHAILNDSQDEFKKSFLFDGSRLGSVLRNSEGSLERRLVNLYLLTHLADKVGRAQYLIDTYINEIWFAQPSDASKREEFFASSDAQRVATNLTYLPRSTTDLAFLTNTFRDAFIVSTSNAMLVQGNLAYEQKRERLAYVINSINLNGFSAEIPSSWFDFIFKHPIRANEADKALFYSGVLLSYYRAPRPWTLRTMPGEFLSKVDQILSSCAVNIKECREAQLMVATQRINDALAFKNLAEAEKLISDLDEKQARAGMGPEVRALWRSGFRLRLSIAAGDLAAAKRMDREITAMLDRVYPVDRSTGPLNIGFRLSFEMSLIELRAYLGDTQGLEKLIFDRLELLKDVAGGAEDSSVGLELKRLLPLVYRASGDFNAAKESSVQSDITLIRRGEQHSGDRLLDLIKMAKNDRKNLKLFYDGFRRNREATLVPSQRNSILVERLLDAIGRVVTNENISWNDFWVDNRITLYAYLLEILAAGEPLDSFSLLTDTAFFENDVAFAVFFSKLYAASFEARRGSLKSVEGLFSKQFTDSRKSYLQSISEFLFKSGDVENSMRVLSIVREQEDAEYSPRTSRSMITKTTIAFSRSELELRRQVETIHRDFRALTFHGIQGSVGSKGAPIDSAVVESSLNLRRKRLITALERYASDNRRIATKAESVIASDPGAAYVVSSVTEGKAIFYLRHGKAVKKVELPIDRPSLRSLIYTLRSGVLDRNDSVVAQKVLELQRIMSPLSAAIKEWSPGKFSMLPDDVLSLLPTSLLSTIFPSDRFGGFLAPSDSRGVVKSSSRGIAISGFGVSRAVDRYPALPSVKREVEMLLALPNLNSESRTVRLDSGFTKTALLEDLRSHARTIHIASHFDIAGLTDESARLLLGDGTTVSLAELARVGTDLSGVGLITLSACETAISPGLLGAQSRTINGLASVFSRLGVRSVLASLWKVDDVATADFMSIFYLLHKTKGYELSRALSLTQEIFAGSQQQLLAYLSREHGNIVDGRVLDRVRGFKQPYFWAGFVTISGINISSN